MKKENWEKEEWGGWKIVSEMLDHPDKNGIYPTSECYQKLYEFVVAQKAKDRQKLLERIENFIIQESGKSGRKEILNYLETIKKE